MEADLARFYPDCDNSTLPWWRQAWRIKHLPLEAVLTGNDGWSLADELMSDLLYVQTGKHHPSDPRIKRELAARKAAAAHRSGWAHARRRAFGITGSVLRRKKPT